jgi:beta-phosphoglucomutase-like phosphatase (HAD superfamily)
MELVLFDLGHTLEVDGVLRPGARETLEAIAALRVGGRPAALLGLLSDVEMPDRPDEVPAVRQRYEALLDELGIAHLFEPLADRVTLSAEVGQLKPAPATFRAAVAKAEPGLTFGDVLFVSEDRRHVLAARRLGLAATQLGVPGGPDGGVPDLPGLLPIVRAFVLGADEDEPAADDARRADGAWTLVGDDLVVSGAGPPRTVPATTARGAPLRVHSGVAPDRLHLVTQNGRLFQADHPEVPVLVDRGRQLVVDLDPAEARELRGSGEACWSIRPLPGNTVVLAHAAPEPAVVPPEVGQVVDALDADAFAADLATMAAHPTRHSASDHFDAAATWAAQRLGSAGCAVRTQDVPAGGGSCRNVIGDRPGRGPEPRDVVLVTAHLDSVNRLGPDHPAPGADDNASGSAGVLALAHALAGHPAALDLRFVLFGGEEQGLFGSRRYVESLSGGDRARIRAVVNMDMIGVRNTPAPAVLLEGAAVSAGVVDALARAAAAHTTLLVSTSTDPANSDHVPFIRAGIPAVLTIEGADGANTAVHTAGDVLGSVDHGLALDVLRMNVAFVAEAVGRA